MLSGHIGSVSMRRFQCEPDLKRNMKYIHVCYDYHFFFFSFNLNNSSLYISGKTMRSSDQATDGMETGYVITSKHDFDIGSAKQPVSNMIGFILGSVAVVLVLSLFIFYLYYKHIQKKRQLKLVKFTKNGIKTQFIKLQPSLNEMHTTQSLSQNLTYLLAT